MKVIPMLFLKRCYSFMLLNLSNWHTVVLIQSTKECVSSWLTNVHSRRLNKCTFSVSLNSPFMLLVFLHQKHRWKVPERKTALQRINCNNVRAKKISLENFSSVVSVKWVNNRTQAQLNRRRPRHSSNTLARKQGRIQDFFRRGCTRLLLYFNTNKPNSFFFFAIPVVLENRR